MGSTRKRMHAATSMWAALALFLGACGAGGTTPAGTDAAADDGSDPGQPEETTPRDPQLDVLLRPLLADAEVTPLPPPAAQNANLVALGRALFFDKELSGNRNISCATCHAPQFGTGDDLSVSIGQGGRGAGRTRQVADGERIPRNAPHLFDLFDQDVLFWDSRVRRLDNGNLITPEPALNGPSPTAGAIASQLTSALAAQAIFPLTSGAEMRGTAGENELADAASNLELWDRVVDRLVGSADGATAGFDAYRRLFAEAFPSVTDTHALHIGHVGRAIAAFEAEAFATRASPFDRYLRGDDEALTDEQKRGAILFFGRADCGRCHGGPSLTDLRPHAIGVPQVGPGKDFPGEDTGRALATGNPADRYRFRTPSLRNVAETGPYMHDGAYTTLRAAVAHYIDPIRSLRGYDVSQLAPALQASWDVDVARQDARAAAIEPGVRRGVDLSTGEVDQIVAFLESLTDDGIEDLAGVVPASVPSGLPVAD